jgi:CO dehydrogenase/acetyl-CoA synthase beta subunit
VNPSRDCTTNSTGFEATSVKGCVSARRIAGSHKNACVPGVAFDDWRSVTRVAPFGSAVNVAWLPMMLKENLIKRIARSKNDKEAANSVMIMACLLKSGRCNPMTIKIKADSMT